MDEVTDSVSHSVTLTGNASLATYEHILQTAQYVNREDEPQPGSVYILIQAISPNNVSSVSAAVELTILPVNDHDPVFTQTDYPGVVEENAAPGTVTSIVVEARDGDTFAGTNITYEIADGSEEFAINPTSGAITTLLSLDAEEFREYHLTVVARDNDGDSPRNATSSVTIEVSDINDNAPVFERLGSTVSIPESLPPGSLVLTVRATDADTGTNANIEYLITSISPDDTVFVIDTATGNITLSKSVDFETNSSYYIEVEARNTAPPFWNDTMSVTVTVTDVEESPPTLVLSALAHLYQENSPPLALTTGLTVRGGGHPITSCVVQLNRGPCGLSASELSEVCASDDVCVSLCAEEVAVNESIPLEGLVLNGTHTTSTQMLTFSGGSFLSAYQSILTSLIFFSRAREPTAGTRNVTLQCFGEGLVTNALELSVDVQLIDEFCPEVMSIQSSLQYIEGSGELRVGEAAGLSLTDQDRDPHNTVLGLMIVLTGVRDGSMENIFVTDPQGLLVTVVGEGSGEESILGRGSGGGTSLGERLLGDTILEVTGEASTEVYTGLLQSLVYSNTALEPESGQKVISIFVLDLVANCTARSITVDVRLINDNAPELAIQATEILYHENSPPVPLIFGLSVTDEDNDDMHPITSCVVQLDRGRCDLSASDLSEACASDNACVSLCAEEVAVNESLLLEGIALNETHTPTIQMLALSGRSSSSAYQSILSSLTFFSRAREPTPGTRNVTLQCYDADFASNILELSVDVQLIDEFCPDVMSVQSSLQYIEGSGELRVGEAAGLSLTDQDRDPHNTVLGIRIALNGTSDGSMENISITDSQGLLVTVTSANLLEIILEVSGEASVEVYSTVLRSLVYYNRALEPSKYPSRAITLSLTDQRSSCREAVLTIDITLINDNAPQLFLDTTDTLRYGEESGAQLFAQAAGLRLVDADNTDLFLIHSANVTLEAENLNQKLIGYNTSALPNSVSAEYNADTLSLYFTGEASVAEYGNLLLSLTFQDFSSEPFPENLTITLSVSDGRHRDSIAITLVLFLVNDNPISLQVESPDLEFSEGDSSLRVADEAGLRIVDADYLAEVEFLSILLAPADPSRVTLIVNRETGGNIISGNELTFLERRSLESYQVHMSM